MAVIPIDDPYDPRVAPFRDIRERDLTGRQGLFVAEYAAFGRTSGLAIDRNDVIYTADSESTDRVHPGWQRGIRIGSLKDGKVTIFVPPHAAQKSCLSAR